MTLNAYQDAALRTAKKDISEKEQLIEALMGLNGEAGESIDILKKYLFQGHGLDKEHLAKELGDVLWYLAVSAKAIGYSLDDIARMNIEKLAARYPIGFDAERSICRDSKDI